jgi:hypothetical protein
VTVASVVVKMVCLTHTMVSIPETAVSTNEKIFSAFESIVLVQPEMEFVSL